MTTTQDRNRRIRAAILEELANTPAKYMQPQKALVASVRLSVVPPPTEAELDEALARLPAKYRTVIHLHYFENYDTSEIAVLTGRRASTVRAQLTRARQRLGEMLKGEADV